jgi:hypothetical protein
MRFLAKVILAFHPPIRVTSNHLRGSAKPADEYRFDVAGNWSLVTYYWKGGRQTIDTHPAVCYKDRPCGAVAQLGERLNGIQEVVGSIPIGSTKEDKELSRSP